MSFVSFRDPIPMRPFRKVRSAVSCPPARSNQTLSAAMRIPHPPAVSFGTCWLDSVHLVQISSGLGSLRFHPLGPLRSAFFPKFSPPTPWCLVVCHSLVVFVNFPPNADHPHQVLPVPNHQPPMLSPYPPFLLPLCRHPSGSRRTAPQWPPGGSQGQ